MTTYPTSIDNFTDPVASDTLDGVVGGPSVYHDVQHTQVNDAIKAIETLIGITGSFNFESVTDAALKAPLASPHLTGTPTAPTATPLTNSTQLSTTAYADLAVAVEKARALAAELLLAPLASPALTGTPTAPTASVGTNTTQVATTEFVLANAGVGFPDFTGSGSPEGVQTANWGQTYVDDAASTNGIYVFCGVDGTDVGWLIIGGVFNNSGSPSPGLNANAPGPSGDNAKHIQVILAGGGLSDGFSSIVITDTEAWNGATGTFNAIQWNTTGIDGEQFVTIDLGSRAQFNYTFAADGKIILPKIPTSDAPAYVEGGVYYDSTLHALRMGGAAGWETVAPLDSPEFIGPISTSPTAATASFAAAISAGVQNTAAYDILVTGCIDYTAALAGATLTMGVGSSSTPAQIAFATIGVAGAGQAYFSAVVPAGYYLGLGATGTITPGTVSAAASPL
jgi:hypothetical protein